MPTKTLKKSQTINITPEIVFVIENAHYFLQQHRLSNLLSKLDDASEMKSEQKKVQQIFETKKSKKSSVSFQKLIERIFSIKFELSTKLQALLFFIRAIRLYPNCFQDNLSKMNLFIASLSLAHKLLTDRVYRGKYYASLVGLPCKEIEKLEMALFMNILKFDTKVDKKWLLRLYILIENFIEAKNNKNKEGFIKFEDKKLEPASGIKNQV